MNKALVARDAEFWLRRKRNRWVCGRATRRLNYGLAELLPSYVQTRMCANLMDGFSITTRAENPSHQQNRVVDVIEPPWRYAHRSRGREATRVAVRERRPSGPRLHNSKPPSE